MPVLDAIRSLFSSEDAPPASRAPEAAPVPDWSGDVSVTMLRTVAAPDGAWQYLADRVYGLSVAQADRFILKGWAEGELSRFYDAQERSEIIGNVQHIHLASRDDGRIDVTTETRAPDGSLVTASTRTVSPKTISRAV